MSTLRQEPLKALTVWDDNNYFKKFNIVFTARSLALFFFITYLISGPILNETDIIASVIALSLLTFMALLFAVTLINALRLRNQFEIKVFPPSGDGPTSLTGEDEVIPQHTARIVFRMPAINVFPGFVLKVSCYFTSSDLAPVIFHIYGSSNEPRLIVQDMKFPYRGLWKLAEVSLEYGDRLEFTHYQWDLPREELNQVIRVSVRKDFDSTLPILSSSSRPGDLIQDVHKRQGDYYDLKPYNPSDGMRRILWKLYAKSGELISRHPEASMTPEGEVVIFLVANKRDDHACSACLAYVRQLETLDLRVFFSCEGAAGGAMAHNFEEVHDLMIETVWQTRYSNRKSVVAELEQYISAYQTLHSSGSLQRLILFCSEERLSTETGSEIAAGLGHALESRGIKPVFCIAKKIKDLNEAVSEVPPGDSSWGFSFISRLHSWAIKQEPIKVAPDRQIFSRFLLNCSSNDWQVYQ